MLVLGLQGVGTVFDERFVEEAKPSLFGNLRVVCCVTGSITLLSNIDRFVWRFNRSIIELVRMSLRVASDVPSHHSVP